MRFVTAGCKPVKAGSVRPNRPTFAQPWQWGRFRATPRMAFLSRFFMPNRALTYSPMHILPTSSSKSAPNALATVWCTFSRTDLPKVLRRVPNASVCLTFWRAAQLSLQSCALFVDNFPRSKLGLYFSDPWSHISWKTQGFAPDSVFTREFTRLRTVTLPNYLMMGGWHDDVVDMMVWMPTMTIVRNSEVS